jgi:hypothetical protein
VQSKCRAVVDGDRTSGLWPVARSHGLALFYRYPTTGSHPWLYPCRSLRELKSKKAARELLSTQNHAARMQDFQDKIAHDERFTEEEKQQIIKASYEW